MSVEWRTIPQFPNYEASTDGEIRHKSKFLKPIHITKHQACFVNLTTDGKPITKNPAPLICAAFHGLSQGERKNAMRINGQKFDLRPANLRWATTSEVNQAAAKRGHKQHRRRTYLSKEDYDRIFHLWEKGESQISIAKRIGVSNTTVCKILNGKTKPRYLGFNTAMQIREAYASGKFTYSEIAKRYGIHSNSVASIVRRVTYPDQKYL